MARSRFRLVLLVVVAVASSAAAQSGARLRGEAEAAQTRKRLTEAQQKLTSGKPGEAADELLRILDESGDDLVLVKDGHFQPARRLVQQSLATLPPDALRAVQNRLDEPARKLLDAARKARDPAPLVELLARYFVSRPAEDALLLLGELAFERGDFTAAARHWRMLLPGESPDDLAFPTPKTDPSLVRAKLALAHAYAGDLDRAKVDLEKLRTDHPAASGRIDGKDGKYADTLAALIAHPPGRQPDPDADGWSTFGGGPDRNSHTPTTLPRYWEAGRPTWATPVPRDPGDQTRRRPSSMDPPRTLAFHPVVVGGYAYLADAGRVFRFDQKTGAARIAFDYTKAGNDLDIPAADQAGPNLLDADFTLTAGYEKLFARIGPAAVPGGGDAKKPVTYLVALAPSVDAKPGEQPLKLRWKAAPPVAADVPAAWEGAPLCADGRLYAAFVRVENSRVVQSVACLTDPPAAKPLWAVDVCDSDANQANGVRHRHELLTLAGANVVFTTHTGATVALKAATGKPAWAFRNPPAAVPPLTVVRDLCPPVYHDGRVFIAPADGDGVYALDADTGRPLWSATGLQVDQLLGVARGRLVATIHSPNKGVRGFRVTDGSTREPDGWVQHDDPRLGTYGRGLVSDDLILWPTAASLYLLNAADGRPVLSSRPFVPGPHGNLACADGVVLVATPTEVWGYVFDPKEPSAPNDEKTGPFVSLPAKPPKFDPTDPTRPVKWGFDPVAAPRIAVPVVADNAASALPGSWPLRPISADDGTLVVCDGQSLAGVNATDGARTWRVKLDGSLRLTHATTLTDGRVLAVGPSAVVCVSSAAGKLLWEFRLPRVGEPFEITASVLAGSRVVLQVGERHLLALDLDTGQPAWALDALGRPRCDPPGIVSAPRFGPHIVASGSSVIVQRSTGERWTVDAADGRILRTDPSPLVDWSGPPVMAEDGGWVAESSVKLAFVRPGRVPMDWLILGNPAGMSGRPPQARRIGDSLLVAAFTNVGVELSRRSAALGRDEWRAGLLLPTDDLDLTAADADKAAVYLPTRGEIIAVDWRAGRKRWACPLPDVPDGVTWRVIAGRTDLIAYPDRAIPDEPFADVLGRVCHRLATPPPLERLPDLLFTLTSAAAAHTLPVLFVDPATGEVRQRLGVPTLGPTVRVVLAADVAGVASFGAFTRLKAK